MKVYPRLSSARRQTCQRSWLVRVSTRSPASPSQVLHRREPVPVGADGLLLARGGAPCLESHLFSRVSRFLSSRSLRSR